MTQTNRNRLLTLKACLPHTWTPFFAKHGNFTPVQQQAIPSILDGKNTLVIAATASGKTEAAIVPLLERYCLGPIRQKRVPQPPKCLRILYISPTRALVRDLYERLRGPFAALKLSLAMKSGDTAHCLHQKHTNSSYHNAGIDRFPTHSSTPSADPTSSRSAGRNPPVRWRSPR